MHALALENVENTRRPLGIWTIVEGESDFVGTVAILLHSVGVGVHVHVLIDDELLSRVRLVGIDLNGAPACFGKAGDANDFAFALGVDTVAWLHRSESAQRVRAAGLVPDI